MEDTTQCTSMGEYKEVSKQILPIDGQILGRNSEVRHNTADCGDSILYPRGDESLIIHRIGPMLGSDKCNIVTLDINENLIKRDYDYGYRDIVSRDMRNCQASSDDNGDCGEVDCCFNYAITEKMFKLFDEAYSEALDELNMFTAELASEYVKAGSPKYQGDSFKYIRRMICPDDQVLNIGTCLMEWDGERMILFRIRNRKVQIMNTSSIEWEAASFTIAPHTLEYRQNDTFNSCLIHADIENPRLFGPKMLVFYEIDSDAFDQFEAIYSKSTKRIQELRDMTVNEIHVMEYNRQVLENNSKKEEKK